MTKQRKIIKDILADSAGHMTAEEIYFTLKSKGIRMAIGTVYRNLALLASTGEIRHIPVCGGPDRYDKSVHPHDHFICSVCGSLCDVNLGDIKSLIEEKTGQKIDSYHLVINYVCPACKAAGKTQNTVGKNGVFE